MIAHGAGTVGGGPVPGKPGRTGGILIAAKVFLSLALFAYVVA
jgi:hypothetical protein